MIFVDTGAWFARFVPDDPDHDRVAAWLATNSDLLCTSDYCVDETLTLIAARKRPRLAVETGRELFDESLARLYFLTSQQINRAWILFQQRAAAGWSFTDCTSKILIDDLEMKNRSHIRPAFSSIRYWCRSLKCKCR
jgi:predicted nucleic acid-binding protein